MGVVPGFLGNLAQGGKAAHPGVDVEHVDPPVPGLDGGNNRFGGGGIGNVRLVARGAGNAGHGGVDGGPVTPGQVDRAAFGREHPRGGQPHARIAAEDEHDLVLESHMTPLFRSP